MLKFVYMLYCERSGPDLVEKIMVEGVGPEYQGEQDESGSHARLKYK